MIKALGAAGAALASGKAFAGGETQRAKTPFSVSVKDEKVKLVSPEITGKAKIMFIGDAHISYADGLEEPYLGYASRMHKAFAKRPKIEALQAALKTAADKKFDLVLLGGDIINFPSEHNIKTLLEAMKNSKVPCKYISGNHDWHFEGSGADIPQTEVRAKWIKKLEPLFFGENPDGYAVSVGGLKILMIDDSAHNITESQLEWARRELSDGKPAVFCAHIPLYFPSRKYYAIGSPLWGAATDRSYKIERRQKRPPRQSPETFAFRELVIGAPNSLGILAGHTHALAYDFSDGVFQAVCPLFAREGKYITLEIGGA